MSGSNMSVHVQLSQLSVAIHELSETLRLLEIRDTNRRHSTSSPYVNAPQTAQRPARFEQRGVALTRRNHSNEEPPIESDATAMVVRQVLQTETTEESRLTVVVRRSTIKCNNCNSLGHMSRDCPEQRVRRVIQCSGCGSDQHTQEQCPDEVGGTTVSSTSDPDVNNHQVPSNPFFKIILLNGRITRGLIDTGSSHVLVKSSIAHQVGLVVEPINYSLFSVGNAHKPNIKTSGQTTSDISIDGVLAVAHEVLIVPDDMFPMDILVGRTWLELPHVGFYKFGSKLIFETLDTSA